MSKEEHYARRAKDEGYASRAAFKLKELQKKYRLIQKGDHILELGAAPGGWTKVVSEFVGHDGSILCIDLNSFSLPSQSNAKLLLLDMLADDVFEKIQCETRKQFNAVLSDAAPSTSGIKFRDAARSVQLCFRALELAEQFLKPNGFLLVKIFAGQDQDFIDECGQRFQEVKRVKPPASKKVSKEFYVLCRGFLG